MLLTHEPIDADWAVFALCLVRKEAGMPTELLHIVRAFAEHPLHAAGAKWIPLRKCVTKIGDPRSLSGVGTGAAADTYQDYTNRFAVWSRCASGGRHRFEIALECLQPCSRLVIGLTPDLEFTRRGIYLTFSRFQRDKFCEGGVGTKFPLNHKDLDEFCPYPFLSGDIPESVGFDLDLEESVVRFLVDSKPLPVAFSCGDNNWPLKDDSPLFPVVLINSCFDCIAVL
eukprot:TRINITY_DN84724_c0_g1_i1.p1 TRINITY_DN84724_c0_g1~~TRINITY_DN84724_c0_g1_i1.p1  ORF type:complete len:227 (+),score=23.26 TRINITY_DN84724_c0_g1_i1:3-683(+)